MCLEQSTGRHTVQWAPRSATHVLIDTQGEPVNVAVPLVQDTTDDAPAVSVHGTSIATPETVETTELGRDPPRSGPQDPPWTSYAVVRPDTSDVFPEVNAPDPHPRLPEWCFTTPRGPPCHSTE